MKSLLVILAFMPTFAFADVGHIANGNFTSSGVARVGAKVIVAQPVLQIGSQSYNIAVEYSIIDTQADMNAVCKLYDAGNFAQDYTTQDAGEDQSWTSVAHVALDGSLAGISSAGSYIDTLTCITKAPVANKPSPSITVKTTPVAHSRK